jgi:hypothetical protein
MLKVGNRIGLTRVFNYMNKTSQAVSSERFARTSSVFVLGFGAFVLGYVLSGSTKFMGFWEIGLMGMGAVAALVSTWAIWRGKHWPRIFAAVSLLSIGLGLLVSWMAKSWPLAANIFNDTRHVGFLVGATSIIGLGLIFRQFWARWLGLGFAVAGFVSSGLNALSFMAFTPARTAAYAADTWIHLIGMLWSASLFIALIGGGMHRFFAPAGSKNALWTSRDRMVSTIRWTVLANLVAMPMLLVYAWAQPIIPQTACSALLLAALITVGTALVMWRKVVGALLLVIGGAGLAVQTITTLKLSAGCDLWVSGYYAIFWAPAAALSLVCGVMLAKPVWRLLRG